MSTTETPKDGKHRALPAYLKMRGRAGYRFPAVPTSLGASFLTIANQLLENEWRNRSEIEARQLSQLRALLKFAARHSPFYADRIRACGLDPAEMNGLADFRRLPLLTRVDLQDGFENIRARQLPPGTKLRGHLLTSGSTGSPVRVLATNVTSLMWAACSCRDHIWAGVDPAGSLVSIRHFPEELSQTRTDQGLHVSNWGGHMAQCFVTGPAHLIDVGQDAEAQLSFIVKANPDYLLSYPSNLDALGTMMAERGITVPRLKVVQTIGEVLEEDMRRRLEGAFRARVWDLYSCVEVGYVASQCPGGRGYHVHEENVLVEILDENDQPCEPGKPGRVVLTALTDYASPIIRYDVQDYAALMPGLCPCGRRLLGLTGIIGRQRGQMLLPDGRVRFTSRLSTAIRDAGGIRQFQVIQHERDRVEILIVPMENFSEQQRKRITQQFHSYLGFPIRVSFTIVPQIARTAAGKYIDFVCKAT